MTSSPGIDKRRRIAGKRLLHLIIGRVLRLKIEISTDERRDDGWNCAVGAAAPIPRTPAPARRPVHVQSLDLPHLRFPVLGRVEFEMSGGHCG